MGIDIVFVDAEDYGTHQAYNGPHKEEYWGLGSQYWARNPHVQGYNARFGILLDMVGGKNAEFRYESLSHEVAPNVNEKVWKTANALGFGRYFVQKKAVSLPMTIRSSTSMRKSRQSISSLTIRKEISLSIGTP